MKNSVNIKFESQSVNESFARIAVSAFLAPLNPTINELADIKTAVSEAVTNAIVHGYRDTAGIIEMKINVDGEWVRIEIIDDGTGIEDVEKAAWDVGVACQDGRMFHGPCHLRINLALPLSRVQEAFHRLDKYVFNVE